MRVWIDIANSPHVGLFDPVVKHMRATGWDILLTARDHAQSAELARERWPDVAVVGGESPPGHVAKAGATLGRSRALARAARAFRADVALSHGSYAQIIGARLIGVPAVTMMDYEYQPANHVSFRLAERVIVPSVFPSAQLRRFGAREHKVRRYAGFKEELYLSDFVPSPSVLLDIGVDRSKTLVVFRPPPSGALYHRTDNERFDRVVDACRGREDVEAVLLPRTQPQRKQYERLPGLIVPARAVDGRSLLALADVVVGAGGTMNREAALLGTATYTLFAGRLAAVDAALLRLGYMQDLRVNGVPTIARRRGSKPHVAKRRAEALLELTTETVGEVARQGGTKPTAVV